MSALFDSTVPPVFHNAGIERDEGTSKSADEMAGLPRHLGDGLLLRSAGRGDGGELADFNAAMHADVDLPGPALWEWTRDLFELPHPTFRPERDVTVVEDTVTGRIVSALFLIPQLWSYAGVPVAVGQPELIATHPDHRRRGLVRAQFAVIHEWSRAAGHVWQFISGIPWYYRQFGYVYGIDLAPRPVIWSGTAPPPPTPPDFSLRAATPADVTFLAGVEAQAASGTALGPVRGVEGFALELARRPGSIAACELLIVESRSAGANPIGYVVHGRRLFDGLVSVRAFELRPGQNWLGPTAAVVAHLFDWVREHPDGPGRGIRLALPDGHPAMACAATRLGSGPPRSYGLYVRAPDIVAILRTVTPVLEARLAASVAVGWTGELRIDLYTGGILLAFAQGRLEQVKAWNPSTDNDERAADASMRPDEFLPLLLGSRSVDELQRTTADCQVSSDAGMLLLTVLFPAMPTSRWEHG
jgi:hypothetical protein